MDGMKVFGIASAVIGFAMLMGSVTGINGFTMPGMGFNPYLAAGALALIAGVMIFAAFKARR